MLMNFPSLPEARHLGAVLFARHQSFFLKVSPSRRMKRHTVSWVTDVPRLHSSAASARIVRSCFSAILVLSQSATSPLMIASGGAPRGRADRFSPARAFCPSRTAVAADTLNRCAPARTVSPPATADAIRVRRSSESDDGMAVHLITTANRITSHPQ